MEIKKLSLNNVGRFKDLEIALAPTHRHHSNVTVLVGNNGAGKTTLLKSVAISLGWLVARIRTDKGNGPRIEEETIRNGAHSASISLSVRHWVDRLESPVERYYQWSIAATREGRKVDATSTLADASRLADSYRSEFRKNPGASLPLIAFYPVERSVLDVPSRTKSRPVFDQLDGYEDSLKRGVDFQRFFEWFREREDSENETGVSTATLKKLQESLGPDTELWQAMHQLQASTQDKQLTAVRSAIAAFMPGFENLRVQRKPYVQMVVDKDGATLNILQLSQGEKSLMALVGDIASRLAMMNPDMVSPLMGSGIILIDEVDLHLHPKWQRSLIEQLTATFPHCQFLLTTHSPLVISDSKDVLVYVMDEGELHEQNSLYGLDANQVLLSVMDTDIRNAEVQKRLDELQHFLIRGELKNARVLYEILAHELPSGHIELAKASLLIRKLEVSRAKD